MSAPSVVSIVVQRVRNGIANKTKPTVARKAFFCFKRTKPNPFNREFVSVNDTA